MTSEKSGESADVDESTEVEVVHEAPEPDENDAGEAAEEELDVEAALEAAQVELAAARDSALRAQAEVENIKRRTARDVENAHKYALERFTGELLPVVDNLERAVESAEEAIVEHEAAEAIAEGVKLSLKLFLDTLAKAGVEQLNPVGEPFDPQVHEAMGMVENPDVEPNTVTLVAQKGYTLNGRLVRAAMVMVSKAP